MTSNPFKVAVVTPYYNEPLEWIHSMQLSVLNQTHASTHIIVCDGNALPSPLNAEVIVLPKRIGDYGDTPRAVGTAYAIGRGFDAIAYLDADNGYDHNHIESLVDAHKISSAEIVTSGRRFVSLDGIQMAECLSSNGIEFSDVNCLFFTKNAYHLLSKWVLMESDFHPIDDRVIWHAVLNSGLKKAHTNKITVAYRATHPGIYRDLSAPIPEALSQSKEQKIAQALTKWEESGNPSLRMRWGYKKIEKIPDPVLQKTECAEQTHAENHHAGQVAIKFHPDAFVSNDTKLMGRQVAGAAFFRALMEDKNCSKVGVVLENKEHLNNFIKWTTTPHSKAITISPDQAQNIKEIGVLHLPDISLSDAAWRRAQHHPADWSITGVTHGTASAAASHQLAQLLNAPLAPWDALICTSHAVKERVDKAIQTHAEYLQHRWGAKFVTKPNTTVIPLGIHAHDCAHTPNQRHAARMSLGLEPSDRVVLFLGRLAFHAKAHPFPMYEAIRQVNAKLPASTNIVLIECGWFANSAIERSYEEVARHACPGVRRIVLNGLSAQDKATALAAADIFCSLSDNIQESFGLTPLEAMAAGVPVVVTDWNGYRDTVRHGVDGYLLPTCMPMAGTGADLAYGHATGQESYDAYIGLVSALVSVNLPQLVASLLSLVSNPALCHAMGSAAQERARDFDWSRVLPKYFDLWAHLAAVRAAAPRSVLPTTQPHLTGKELAAYADPFSAFGAYATHPLQMDTLIAVSENTAMWPLPEWAKQSHLMGFPAKVLCSVQEMAFIVDQLSGGARTVGKVLQAMPHRRALQAYRGICWLMKMGVITEIPLG